MGNKTGGPAFPASVAVLSGGNMRSSADLDSSGMTLRDYFAAKALQGMITTAGAPCFMFAKGDNTADIAAQTAYQFADAMLKARGV